jgi:hypothetical protein
VCEELGEGEGYPVGADVGPVAEEGVAGVEELGGGEEAEVGLERCGVAEDV